MSKESLKIKFHKKLQKIAREEGLTHFEVEKIFKSQFKFTKETIEALDREFLDNATEEELSKYVFNYMLLGKVVTDARQRDWAKRTNLINEQNEKRGENE